jgi:hypothetical protein
VPLQGAAVKVLFALWMPLQGAAFRGGSVVCALELGCVPVEGAAAGRRSRVLLQGAAVSVVCGLVSLVAGAAGWRPSK